VSREAGKIRLLVKSGNMVVFDKLVENGSRNKIIL
jgi:hypothetical protein